MLEWTEFQNLSLSHFLKSSDFSHDKHVHLTTYASLYDSKSFFAQHIISVNKEYLYSAFIQRLVSMRSDMDHTVLPANYTMPAFPL